MHAGRGESVEEESLLPLSALQHYLHCPRQCALIHLEEVWAENEFTAEGRVVHERAHEGPDERRAAVRTMRGNPVVSRALGISGQCDVVEFHADGTVLPVEDKRGKPKGHRADEVQLCAQAVALEEMPGEGDGGNREKFMQLKARLLKEADLTTDSLRLYNLGNNWERRVEHHGAKPSSNPEGPLIV
jgi:hypothetical protein